MAITADELLRTYERVRHVVSVPRVRRELAPRQKYPDQLVRRIRALDLMGLSYVAIARLIEIPTPTVQDLANLSRRKEAGTATDRDIIEASQVLARWAIEQRDKKHGGG